MQLNALFCCLWRNVEASCHKHFVVFSGNQHHRLLPAMCHNLRDGGRPPATAFTTPGYCSVNTGSQARYAQNRDFCLPHLHSTPPLGGFPSEYCYQWSNCKIIPRGTLSPPFPLSYPSIPSLSRSLSLPLEVGPLKSR